MTNYDGATCPHCGSAWFRLSSTEEKPAGIALSKTGSIIGWSGVVTCGDCNKTWSPPEHEFEEAEVIPLSSARLRRSLRS